jgi:hypothetical protein
MIHVIHWCDFGLARNRCEEAVCMFKIAHIHSYLIIYYLNWTKFQHYENKSTTSNALILASSFIQPLIQIPIAQFAFISEVINSLLHASRKFCIFVFINIVYLNCHVYFRAFIDIAKWKNRIPLGVKIY